MHTAAGQRSNKMAFKLTASRFILTLLLLLTPLVSTLESGTPYPVSVVVYNSLTNQGNLTLTTEIAYKGILLGAMRRLQETNNSFKFTLKEDPNYGPFLESVNGLAGKVDDRTYWEFLVKLQNGAVIKPDVGAACYVPDPHDTVIFKFTHW